MPQSSWRETDWYCTDEGSLVCGVADCAPNAESMIEFASSDQFADDDLFWDFYDAEDFEIMLKEALGKEPPLLVAREEVSAQGMSLLKTRGLEVVAPERRHSKHQGRDRYGKHRSLRAHRTGFKKNGDFVSCAA